MHALAVQRICSPPQTILYSPLMHATELRAIHSKVPGPSHIFTWKTQTLTWEQALHELQWKAPGICPVACPRLPVGSLLQ